MNVHEPIDCEGLPAPVACAARSLLEGKHVLDRPTPDDLRSGVSLLYCGHDGWTGHPGLNPGGACVVLVEGPHAAALLEAPDWPVSWVRLPWPADAHSLEMAIHHAQRLRDAFATVPAWQPEGAPAGTPAVGALETLGMHVFEFDLKTGRHRGSDGPFMGRAVPTFADLAARIHADDRPTVSAAFDRSCATGCRLQVEYRLRGRNGGYRWMRSDGVVVGRSLGDPGRLCGISQDIHDDREARAELRTAWSQWQQLMSAIGTRSWQWTAQTGRLRFVQNGEAPPLPDLAPHPDDGANLEGSLAKAASSGSRVALEARLADGEGTWRWYRLIGNPLRDGQGEILGLAGVALDTSEWHRLDSEVDELRGILQQSLEAGRIYVTEWDMETGARRLFGPSDEILGITSERVEDALALIHPDDAARVKAVLDATLRTGAPYQLEYRICRPDGQVRWLYSAGRVWSSGASPAKRLTGAVMDVTARRKSEDELAQLVRLHEIALTAAELNPWSVALRDESHRTGPRDVQLFGDNIDSLERFRSHVVPEDRPIVDRLRDPEFLRSETPMSLEFRIRRVDGGTRWIACVARGICDHAGQPVELVGISRDVTDSRLARQQLVDSLAKLDRVQVASGVLLWEWTRRTGAKVAAPGGQVLQGETLPEVHPDDRIAFLRQIARHRGTDKVLDWELRIRTGDSPWRWMSLQGRSLGGEGDPQATYVGVLTDISRSKRAELELAESLQWRQTAVEAARLNLWRIDLESGSRQGGRLDRRWYSQAPTTVDQALDAVHPEDFHKVFDTYRAALAADGDYEVEYRILKVPAEVRWIRVRGRCATNSEGRRELIGVSLDVTEQKLATAELERAVALAREASDAKSAFLASVSHELRTPLNAVIGYAGLLAGAPLDLRHEQYLNALQAGAGQLLAVINDVLDFSRIEAGSLVLESEPLDPLACFESTLALVAAAAEDKGLCLSLECEIQSWPHFLGDATRLTQVGLNILSNAVKFTSSGAVSMRLARETDGDACFLRIEVTDTGIGMSEEALSRLFTPFRQGEESTARRFGGSGLGLSICDRLVAQMKGTISVHSQLGAGTTVSVRLPWSHDRPEGGRTLASLAGRCIGVCVKSRALKDALGRQLRSMGAEVVLLPVELDASWQGLSERIDTLIAGRPALQALASDAGWAAASSGIGLIVLTGFSDGPKPLPDPRALAIPRAIRPSELEMALQQTQGAARLRKPPGPTSMPPESAACGEHRALIVEDNEINQLLLQAQLETLGISADLAGSGNAALAVLAEQTYDWILMDVEMPGMDGLETVRTIRATAMPDANRPWIIAVTAHVFAEMRERIKQAGFDDFIAKPVQIEALSMALARAVQRAGDQRTGSTDLQRS